MKILRLTVDQCDYIAEKGFTYQQNRQIENFKHVEIEKNDSLDNLDPIRMTVRKCFDHRRAKPTVDDKYIAGGGDKKGNAILINSNEVTKALFVETIDFFNKAIYNFSAQYDLSKKGYLAWAKVTNYYSSFFSINALLRLQGRSISRIWKPPMGTRFQIFPFDFQREKYIICCDDVRSGGEHKIIWKLFYIIYNSYNFSNKDFEIIYKTAYNFNNDPYMEVDYRNDINYRVCYSFEEIWDPTLIETLVKEYIQNSSDHVPTTGIIKKLKVLSTDPKYMYFARSALRLLLTYSIIDSIVDANNNIQDFWETRKENIIDFLDQTLIKHYESDNTTLGSNLDYPLIHSFS